MRRLTFTFLLFGIIAMSSKALADQLSLDFPGPYCETLRPVSCCTSREDSCAVPIAGTICYCDQFCDQHLNADCCPDYRRHCLGELAGELTECSYKGHRFGQGQQIIDNCNVCKCRDSSEAVCETDVCLTDASLINNVNSISESLGWLATNYSEFWGRKYNEGLELRLGTKIPSMKVQSMSKISNRPETLPTNFNALDQWPGFISDVRDQGWCGSSWALSTATVASDRYAIQSKGNETVLLSPQQLLSCAKSRENGCKGGRLDRAWNYMRKTGIVDDECYPYVGVSNVCKIKRTDNLRSAGCTLPTKVARDHLYRTSPAYSLSNETDIMIDILDSGPVQATMKVYRDFFSYKSGIYRHSAASRSEPTGFHSVRLIGWGIEPFTNTKYWLAANSWGTWWGERGYFRILRGVNECEIENYVLASWADVYLKKSPIRPLRRQRFNKRNSKRSNQI